jgi:hypothetical protein
MRVLTSLLLLSLLAGCGTDEGTAGPYLQASISGVSWREAASEGVVVYSVDHPDGSGSIFTIAARDVGAGVQLLSLNLPNPPAIGTYPLTGGEVGAVFSSCPNNVLADCISFTPVPAHPGTLEITSIDPETGRITGTFSFTGYALGDTTGSIKHVTGGSFDIRAPGVFVLE